MNLDFSPPARTSTDRGDAYVQTAFPTEEFWRAWRGAREEMAQAGITVDRSSGDWLVRKLTYKIDGGYAPAPVRSYTVRNTVNLKPWQPAAVAGLCAALLSERKAVEGSDAGAGKTYTTLATCRELKLHPGVITTKSAIVHWKRACDYMGVYPLFIVNWDRVIGRLKKGNLTTNFPYIRLYGGHYKWVLPTDAVLLFDECHKAAGQYTQMAKIFRAAKDCRVIAASATLAKNLPGLRSLGELCGLYNKYGFDAFLQDHGCFKNRFNGWESVSESETMQEIHKLIFPRFGVRVRKIDIPGFPAVQNIAESYEIRKTSEQNKEYQALVNGLKSKDEFIVSAVNGVQKLQSLVQPGLKPGSTDVEIARLKTLIRDARADKLTLVLRYRQLTEMYKVILLGDLVTEHLAKGENVVVFVNFTATLEALAKKLKTTCVIHGGQKADDRQKNIDDFQADRQRVIVCNVQAGGESISLHDLHGRYPRVSLICPTYRAISLVQVLGRIHRAGAKSPAINYLIHAAGTVEDQVCERVKGRLENITALMDGDLEAEEIFKLKGADETAE